MQDNSCPKCEGQLLPDTSDVSDLSCLQCGHIVYGEQPEKDGDRRNLLDNRQAEKPFAEYKRALCHCKQSKHRKDCEFKRLLEEVGIDDPTE